MSQAHLSLQERYYIEKRLRNGQSIRQIARDLSRSASTIFREIERNRGKKGYRHNQAHRNAGERHKKKRKALKLTKEAKELINRYLKERWSREQIAGWLKREGMKPSS